MPQKSEECVGEGGAEGVDAVGVLFPVRVGEVAQENDSGAGTGIGYDARPGETCFAECPGRRAGSHELRGIQFPTERGAGEGSCGAVHGAGERREFFAGKRVGAYHIEDSRGRDSSLAVFVRFMSLILSQRRWQMLL